MSRKSSINTNLKDTISQLRQNLKTCCICFWGATRQVKLTHKNIKKKVINPLRKYYNVKIFIHTWDDNDDFKLLEPDYYQTDDQSKIDFHIKEIRNRWVYIKEKLKYIEHFKAIENTPYQLYSLKQVTKLMISKISNPDLVIFMRQDELFVELPDISKLNIESNQIITPAFGNYYWNETKMVGIPTDNKEKGGVNDRFAICGNVKIARIYGERYDKLLEYIKKHFPNPEGFLENILYKNKIQNIKLKEIKFYLVRDGGILFAEKFL
jgi:hypothetical protein